MIPNQKSHDPLDDFLIFVDDSSGKRHSLDGIRIWEDFQSKITRSTI